MTEQRRVVLAVFLVMLVWLGGQYWYGRIAPTPEEPAADSIPLGGPQQPEVLSPRPADTTDARELFPAEQLPTTVEATDQQPSPEESPTPLAAPGSPVVVETPLYRLSIDPGGAVLRQAALLRYDSFTEPGPVLLVPEGAQFLMQVADVGGRRLALSGMSYVPSDTLIRLSEGDPPRTLRLVGTVDAGVELTYRFDPASYVIEQEVTVGHAADGVLVTSIGPRLHSNEKQPRDDYGQLRAMARVRGEIVTRQAKQLDEGEGLSLGGEISWAGLRNKYFLATVLAPAEGPPLSAVTMTAETSDSLPWIDVAVAAPISGGTGRQRLYLGPQEYRRLSALNDGLDEVSQYGWSWLRWMITPFAKAIVIVMLWLHRFIPSYGLVLIVFGVLVRVVTWPLTTKSYRSIRDMQALQPDIQRLRERHKDDPQRMQQETMRLYRERKVNPMGGCLPNLIPMPILFALFFVFQSTIEFRGQRFLWLPDLSQPDPFYLLPIFLGLTMLASSRLTTSDPRMAAMTYVMPIVLTFVFINLAAGLVLYYAFSNLLTFGQQWWLKTRFDTAAQSEENGG